MSVTVGLAGAGRRAAEVYAPLLAASAGVRFVGIWAPATTSAERIAARHDLPAYERYHHLLADSEAVVFSVPPARQAELAAIAARQGRAVLVEQPLAADLACAEDLVREVESAGIVSQLALVWRYAPATRDFLRMGVGRVHPVGGRGRYVSSALVRRVADHPGRLSRGVLQLQGPHLVDLLDAALGPVVRIHAHGDPLGWVGLLLDHAGGHFSEASLCATAPVASRYAEVEVFGPGGAARLDVGAAVGWQAFATMVEEFVAAVEVGTAVPLDVRHGLRLQRVLDTAERELFTGG